MTRAALVGSVAFNHEHFRALVAELVIAVDGGLRHLEQVGVRPDIALGDFDSLGFVPQGIETHTFPAEKDESDMELACRTALECGADELVLYGALGQRLDHTLANIQVMLGCARRGARCWAIGDDYALTVLVAPGALAGLAFDAVPLDRLQRDRQGPFLSVFALGGPAQGVRIEGMKYCLVDATVPDDASLGLSNEFTEAPARIGLESGALAVVFPLAAWDYLRPCDTEEGETRGSTRR